MVMEPRVIDLFCGAGGFSEGFRRAGFRVVLGIDKEIRMLASYRANHPDTEVWQQDVLTISPSELPEAEVIIGSPPCQPFSIANPKRNPEEGMELVNWMLEVIVKKKPKFWVMENVPPVAKHLPRWIPVIKVLNAVEYGVPQVRRRCFAGNYPLPSPTHAYRQQHTLDGRVLKPFVTVGEALSDLPPPSIQDIKIASPKAIERLQSSQFGLRILRTDKPSYTIRTYSGGCPQNTEPLVEHTLPAGELIAMYKRNLEGAYLVKNPPLKIDKPSRVVKAHLAKSPKELLLPIGKTYRRLTVREVARLQSFPDSYKFVGPRTWQYRQVGEAVPPLLAWHIANAIRPSLGLAPLPAPNSFLEWIKS